MQLCIAKGTRTNVPPPTELGAAGTWCHKYMYRGLHVVCDAARGSVITAYWACADDEPERAQSYIREYDNILKMRRAMKERKVAAADKKRARK